MEHGVRLSKKPDGEDDARNKNKKVKLSSRKIDFLA